MITTFTMISLFVSLTATGMFVALALIVNGSSGNQCVCSKDIN